MKYMISTFGDATDIMKVKSPEWIKSMIEFMGSINEELTQAGELAAAEGLAYPSQAKTVRFQNGQPVPTDGPFAEAKESLAGFWIVDVENEGRALEIASKIVAFVEAPIEVRQVLDEPPSELTQG